MAREQCDVVVLIAANHAYGVLRTELGRHGNHDPGPQAGGLTSLADPQAELGRPRPRLRRPRRACRDGRRARGPVRRPPSPPLART